MRKKHNALYQIPEKMALQKEISNKAMENPGPIWEIGKITQRQLILKKVSLPKNLAKPSIWSAYLSWIIQFLLQAQAPCQTDFNNTNPRGSNY